MATPYVRTQITLYDWQPFLAMTFRARVLWRGLIETRDAHQCPPGLFYGSVTRMAEASGMGSLDAQGALRELLDSNLVETNPQLRLTRLTQLPDHALRAPNGRCIKRFWTLWERLPECDLKYRHIPLLWWLNQPMTADHQKHWDDTFGKVYDVSSLRVVGPVENPQISMFERGSLTVSDTVSGTVSDTPQYTVDSQIQGETGQTSDSAPDSSTPREPDSPSPPTVLPPEQPFTVEELLHAVAETSSGRVTTEIWDPNLGDRLWGVVERCGEANITLDDLRLAGEFFAAGYLHYRDDLDAKWLAGDGNLIGAVAKARGWDKAGRPPLNGPKGAKKPSKSKRLLERAARLRAAAQEA